MASSTTTSTAITQADDAQRDRHRARMTSHLIDSPPYTARTSAYPRRSLHAPSLVCIAQPESQGIEGVDVVQQLMAAAAQLSLTPSVCASTR